MELQLLDFCKHCWNRAQRDVLLQQRTQDEGAVHFNLRFEGTDKCRGLHLTRTRCTKGLRNHVTGLCEYCLSLCRRGSVADRNLQVTPNMSKHSQKICRQIIPISEKYSTVCCQHLTVLAARPLSFARQTCSSMEFASKATSSSRAAQAI